MKGIRRHLGVSVTQKKPITPAILKNILMHLDVTSSLDTTVWAVCLTMFYGLLRRSNVILHSASEFDTSKHLRRRDILFFPWGLLLHIRWSKVIQFQSRTFDIPLPRMKNSVLCPVQVIFNYQQPTMGADMDSPAFTYRANNKLTVLTSDKFICRVRQCLSLCNVNPSDIATHSFRRGVLAFAILLDFPLTALNFWVTGVLLVTSLISKMVSNHVSKLYSTCKSMFDFNYSTPTLWVIHLEDKLYKNKFVNHMILFDMLLCV